MILFRFILSILIFFYRFKEYWQEIFQCQLPEEQAQALALSDRMHNDFSNNQSDNSLDNNELMLGDLPSLFDSSLNRHLRRSQRSNLEQVFENAYEKGDRKLLKRLEMFQRLNDEFVNRRLKRFITFKG